VVHGPAAAVLGAVVCGGVGFAGEAQTSTGAQSGMANECDDTGFNGGFASTPGARCCGVAVT
jgi:hypothetical protein